MTTLALRSRRSPVALQGLPWTVLRLHRAALLVWSAFVVACVAGIVWLNAFTAHSVRAAQADRASSGTLRYSEPMGWIGTFIHYSPWVVAAYAAGALIGRELENGTAQLAWTQSVSPARWLAAKLAVPAAVLTLGGAVLIVAFRWGWAAHRDLMGDNWTFSDAFMARGPLIVAYTLCALAIGTLTAIVLRRALPALGVSLALLSVLNFLLTGFRWHLWPALTRTAKVGDVFTLPDSALTLEWGGITTPGAREEGAFCFDSDAPADLKRCMTENHLTSTYVTYHPASHFWPLHLMETGIVLAVTAAATSAAFWLLRRRTA